MAVTMLRKPILVGGLGLTIIFWLWESLHKSMLEVGQIAIWGAIVVGTGLWLLQQKIGQKPLNALNYTPITPEEVTKAIAEAKTKLTHVATEAPDQDLTIWQQQITQLPEQLQRQELQLVVTGGRGVGKSKLKQVLGTQNLNLGETEALFTDIEQRDQDATEITLNADLVLLIINGDLTDSEWQFLQNLASLRQRVLLLLNKQDQYQPEEKSLILQQLKQRVKPIIPPTDVIPIAASPIAVKVRQHQEDGSVQEWLEQPEAEIHLLSDRLQTILSRETEQLIWTTTWRKAINIENQLTKILNQARRDRAIPVIEQYQLLAAGAAFANPVAALDLLATAAINAQMLIDLGAIYQQKFSLAQAQNASGTIGKLMVQLGLVELSTQTIGTILKSNVVTFVAGGAIQGVSAAYLTRLAGLSLIEYFQEQELNNGENTSFNLDRLGNQLKAIFQQNQRSTFLTSFVKQTVGYLKTETATVK